MTAGWYDGEVQICLMCSVRMHADRLKIELNANYAMICLFRRRRRDEYAELTLSSLFVQFNYKIIYYGRWSFVMIKKSEKKQWLKVIIG